MKFLAYTYTKRMECSIGEASQVKQNQIFTLSLTVCKELIECQYMNLNAQNAVRSLKN